MRYRHVCIEAISYTLPPHVVTSEELEQQLAPVYDRLRLPEGRLELMSGIKERRFYDPGTLPGMISAQTARKAITESGLDPNLFGALIHGSVCRDQMEPATACGVHHAAGLPQSGYVFDVSNACLGLLNGMILIADLIELGRIEAGIVVGTEIARNLVEGTIESLLKDETLTRQSIKPAFASLTIGSGSAAIALCHERHSTTGRRLLGGQLLVDTTSHNLCEGGVEQAQHGDSRPRMNTDSEALLHAGVDLAAKTWEETRRILEWSNADVNRAVTHQVGRAHRKLLLDRLELPEDIDFPTVEWLGNTGAVALPTAAAIASEEGAIKPGDHVALLGIGSGLNCIMLGVDW
ncbi:MAG: 3-oxoacyl-ACP synthase III [Planctomycetaceae bacterium]|nr:3-oxoacyl-ACP synthase III [Planctomycetaceae bacterium]